MRFVLVMVLVAGCAVEEDYDPRIPLPPCAPFNMAQVLEPLDTTVSAPAVDVMVRWRTGPSHFAWVRLTDAVGMSYEPTQDRAPDGVIVYHYTLPPSTAFDFRISEYCYDGDITMPKSHTYGVASTKFRTGL